MVLAGPQLGFSVTAPFKKVAQVTGRVLQDPRTANVAQNAAGIYAPKQYAQAQAAVAQAQRLMQKPGTPAPLPQMPMLPMFPEPRTPVNRNSQILTIGGIAVGAVILLMLLKN